MAQLPDPFANDILGGGPPLLGDELIARTNQELLNQAELGTIQPSLVVPRQQPRAVREDDDASLLAEAAKSIGRIPGQLVEGVGGILQILGAGIGGILPGVSSGEASEFGRLVSEVGQELQDPLAPDWCNRQW